MTALLGRPTAPTESRNAARPPSGEAAKITAESSATKQSRAKTVLVVGGRPTVDLLPPEVRALQRSKGVQRMSVALVAIVAAVVVTAIVLATLLASNAASTLAAAQGRTASLVQAQGQFIEGRTASEEINSLIASRSYATETELDWTTVIQKVTAGLPDGATIDSALAAVPPQWESELTPADDLRSGRVASLTLTVITPTLEGATEWVRSLRSVPGYADATTDHLIYSPESGEGYRVTVTVNVDEGARLGRFVAEEE